MSVLSISRGYSPLTQITNVLSFNSLGISNYNGYYFNGRLILRNLVVRDGRTLEVANGTPGVPCDASLGRLWRMEQNFGDLQTSDDYGLTWTERVPNESFRINIGGTAPAGVLSPASCFKIGSTWHFYVVCKRSANPADNICELRHISTANFSTWSSVTRCLDSGGFPLYSFFSVVNSLTPLKRVGSTLVYLDAVDASVGSPYPAYSTDGLTWTRGGPANNPAYTRVQAFPGERLFNFSAVSEYTDDGINWTVVDTQGRSFGGSHFYYNSQYYVLASIPGSFVWMESPDPVNEPFQISPMSSLLTSDRSASTAPESVIATPYGVAQIYQPAVFDLLDRSRLRYLY